MFHVKHKIITIHNEAVTMATGMIRKKSIVDTNTERLFLTEVMYPIFPPWNVLLNSLFSSIFVNVREFLFSKRDNSKGKM